MTLVDNGQALNLSGKITALSVNKCAVSINDPKSKTPTYAVTLTLETDDKSAVEQLILVRSRKPLRSMSQAKLTADLIVWPT
jgi:hypothetical protein